MRRNILAASAVMAACLSTMSMAESGFGESEKTGPGNGSKGIVRNRLPREPNEHNTSKPKSASLKRLLRK